MMGILEFLQHDGDFVFLNLILQLSILCVAAIALASRFKNNAVVRYSILFPALLSLLLLTSASLLLQSRHASLFYLPIPSGQAGLESVSAEFIFGNPIDIGLQAIDLELESISPGQVAATGIADVRGSINPWSTLLSLPPYLFAVVIWIGGLLFLTIGLLRSFHNVDKIIHRSRKLCKADAELLHRLLAENLVTGSLEDKHLHFRTSEMISSPMLVGLVNPVVLLPERFIQNLNDKQLRGILLHELAHYERNDSLANFLQKVVLTIFWFHPLVHLMDKMISRAREEICDNYVLSQEQALDYGEALLQVSAMNVAAGNSKADAAFAVGVFGGEWKLEQRISELFCDKRERAMTLGKNIRWAFRSAILSFSLLLATCQLGAEDNEFADQVVVLEDQSNQLLEQKRRLQRQAEAVEQQALVLSEQREIAASVLAYSKEQLLRSLAELKAVLLAQGESTNVDDISSLTSRILTVALRQSQLAAGELFSKRTIERMEATVRGLEEGSHDRDFLWQSLSELSSLLAVVPGADVDDQQTTPPELPPIAQGSEVLSEEVMQVITQIQQLMSLQDKDVEPDLDAAKALLDQLYQSNYAQMNSFEKSTTLNFYTNYYLSISDYGGAIETFEETLHINQLREDIVLRTLRSLGQLYAAEEQWQNSIDNYSQWRELSIDEDDLVFRGLSYAHYQLQQYAEALPHWLSYMEIMQVEGTELERDTYMYLNGLYFTLEDLESALETTKEMILLFNHPTDWNNLRAIYATLDRGSSPAAEPDETITAVFEIPPVGSPVEELVVSSTMDAYPSRARQRGVEGWVLLSFTVSEEGNVVADSIAVVDAEPPNIFHRAAIRASSKFMFTPRLADGVGVAVPDVQYLFSFVISEDV